MRGMDGIEATRRLQADPATAPIPVLAVTASPYKDAREAALEAGCCDFLAKPVRPGDLIGALGRHLGVRFEPVTSPTDPAGDSVEDLGASGALAGVAERLRQAAMIGSVSELHAIARELALGDAQHSRLGHRIARLTNEFEFEAIEQLAARKREHDGHAAE
jgi:CheY-like chemotaxis protein